ncbi:hypothetical protein TNCT_97571 [Trichonephila clavata]|uniref:Uncharacterized protein n=1 Tax=Trichonephila clavata TaxID=2740835 RepID=A0A8X6LNG7_TRICU|nr:hypothetical protein TNCT_97571 [Trichonephila clavata]
MTPPYVRFTQRFLPYTRYFSRFPHVVSTFALHVESWGASRRPHRGPSAFTVLPFPYGHPCPIGNASRFTVIILGSLQSVDLKAPFPPMIENPLFFKRSLVGRLLSYVPGSFSPRGVSHRPCSFGLNFIPLLCTLLLPFSAQAKSVSRRHSP